MLHQIASLRGDAAGRKARFNARVLPALLVFGAAALAQTTHAASSTPSSYGLYNTGVPAGVMLGMEAADPDYTVTYEGTASPTDPGTPLTSSTMYVTATTNASGQPYLPWQPADNSTSAFISPFPTYAAGQSNQGGTYDVTTTFTLSAGDFASVALFGRFESDDAIENIFVNGVSTGITQPPEGYEAFSGYYDLSSFLQAGTNTIRFQLFNYTTGTNTDPVALRTEFSAVPEPSVWAGVGSLLGLGLLGRWLSRRRAVATV